MQNNRNPQLPGVAQDVVQALNNINEALNSGPASVGPIPDPTPRSLNPPSFLAQPANLSELECEWASFVWHIHNQTMATSVIPEREIVDPANEPNRDTSPWYFDHCQKLEGATFTRGQELNQPYQWKLHLELKPSQGASSEPEVHLVLTCGLCVWMEEKREEFPVWVKFTVEYTDREGNALRSFGRVCDAQPVAFNRGTSQTLRLGTKRDLQELKEDCVENDGIWRIRLRLNIYRTSVQVRRNVDGGNSAAENYTPAAKRSRPDPVVEPALNFMGILKKQWEKRDESGDILIKCAVEGLPTVDIRAHKVVLSMGSDVFSRLFNTSMSSEEQTSNEIRVEDIRAPTMFALLEYLYKLECQSVDWHNLDEVFALIYATDKYMIRPLLNVCFEQLVKSMNLENFAKIAKVAFTFDCGTKVKNEVKHFYDSHQVTLNNVESFRKFANDDFDEFYLLFFYEEPAE